jgi:steroid delta-isomerase-like uncharacterized protein
MTIEANKTVVRRYYEEVLNTGHVNVLAELAVADYAEHDPLPGQGTGRDGLRDRVELLRGAFRPHFTIEDIIAEGDKVAVRWTNRGTHVGEFMGLPATGKAFVIAGIDIHRLRDGQLAEHWHVVDLLGQLQQLGILPQPAGASA